MSKYIFITGGVVSSLGKGLAAAALGAILQARGFSVKLRKLDPYLNIDPGTMSPHQHGEVYVTNDGTETDLDLGHYERFTGVDSKRSDSITTGKIYSSVLLKEREGKYLGATVQVVPHIIDEIKTFIISDTEDADFIICEIGGTVGDIESLPFLEAIRQLSNDLGRENTLFLHVTLLPYIAVAGEIKTKPTQHSVKELLSVGIQPDILLCRSDRTIPEEARKKLGLFCNIKPDRVIEANDLTTIYEAPLVYHNNGLDKAVCDYFNIQASEPNLKIWVDIVKRIQNPEGTVNIGVVGKYMQLLDAYKSIREALVHAGIENKVRVNLNWIDSESLDLLPEKLAGMNAILVPGGFGERGALGKIRAIQYARERNIPFFGICFGMQLTVIEACRNLLGIEDASTTEFGQPCTPVVGLLSDLNKNLGGTMRLGSYPCYLDATSKAKEIYGTNIIHERHRHRYEVDVTYKEDLEKVGLFMSGLSVDNALPEIVERRDHPWFVAVQFHPELKSRPFDPHPLFVSFIKAAIQQERLI